MTKSRKNLINLILLSCLMLSLMWLSVNGAGSNKGDAIKIYQWNIESTNGLSGGKKFYY